VALKPSPSPAAGGFFVDFFHRNKVIVEISNSYLIININKLFNIEFLLLHY
jgi:hypothetical protein